MKGFTVVGKNLPKPQAIENPNASSNHFVVLSSPEVPILEEGELQQFEVQDDEPKVNTGPMEQAGATNSELPSVGESLQQNHPSLSGAKTSPSYAEITKKKLVDSSGSSDEDSIEQLSKKSGRKSRKEARVEEADKQNMWGSQSTIEMSFGISKRNWPSKGVITPSLSSK